MILFNKELDSELLGLQHIDPNEVWEDLLSDLANVSDLLAAIIKTQYLNPCPKPMVQEEYQLEEVLQLPDYTFKQALRTSKDGFIFLLNEISSHEVFIPRGNRPQLPVAHQLALTLERLGSSGNGASVGRFSRNLNVGRGTVVKVTRRVIEALISLGPKYLKWPDSN